MRPIVVIPARYESSRFPGKPLADIAGKSLIRRVWERCTSAVDADDVIVATDDERIQDHAESFGARTEMTSSTCRTGTDRVHEVSRRVLADVYVNVQGDEPLVDPAAIQAVIDRWTEVGHVVNAMAPIDDPDDFARPSVPKVVAAPDGRLLYMSRAGVPTTKDLAMKKAWKQVCIYAYDQDTLSAFATEPTKTPLEEIEDIEILRFLELGHRVTMVEVAGASVAVDYPEDIDRILALLASQNKPETGTEANGPAGSP